MKTRSTRKASIFSLALLLVLNPVHAAKLYKWVDAQGRVSYQDTPPPKRAKILSEKTLKDKSQEKEAADNKDKITKKTTPVDVYVTRDCPGCEQVIENLEGLKVPYNEKQIESHRDIQSRIIQETSSLLIPAVFIDNKLINITTNTELKNSLQASGYTITDDETQSESDGTTTEQ